MFLITVVDISASDVCIVEFYDADFKYIVITTLPVNEYACVVDASSYYCTNEALYRNACSYGCGADGKCI